MRATSFRITARLPWLLALLLLATLVAAGCGSDSDSDSGSDEARADEARTLVVYSGREKELAEPIYDAFTKATGIKVEARYAESPALAAQLLEEGERSPADVFYAQDAGAIGVVADQLAKLDADVLEQVPSALRDDEDRWTGVTGRARTLVYNTDDVRPADLPKRVTDVTDERWKGRVGVAPTNSSFIAFMSAMRLQEGDAAAKAFLEGLVANDAKIFEKNGKIVDAVASGEVEIGLVNHYYLYEKLGENPDLPIANHHFAAGDAGSLINVSAVGILEGSKNADEAREFVAFLLDDGQELIASELSEREYPVVAERVADNARYAELPPLSDTLDAQKVDLAQLGDELEKTVKLIDEVGLGA